MAACMQQKKKQIKEVLSVVYSFYEKESTAENFVYGYTLDFSCSLAYNVAIILFNKNYNIGVFV